MGSGEHTGYERSLHDWSTSLQEQADAQRRRRRIRRWLAAAIAAAVLAVGAIVGWVVVPSIWYNHNVYNKQYLLGKYETRLGEAAHAQLLAALPQLQAFVEHNRGGRFVHPVTMRFLPDDKFYDVWGTPADVDTKDAVALGFANSKADARHQLQQLQNIDVPGFYDKRAHVLYIRGQEFDDYAQVILVNALTQAYDDQHFTLSKLTTAKGDAFDAASALIEGDAMVVQNAFTETLPLGERCIQLTDSLQTYDPQCVAAGYNAGRQTQRISKWGLQAETNFPYVVGPRFVRSLISHGGQAEVDRAFRRPPTTTAQILDPADYFRDVTAAPVSEPLRQAGTQTSYGVLGAMQLSALVTDGYLGVGDAAYLHGWRGDRAVTYEQAGRGCLADAVLLTSRSGADAAAAKVAAWAKRHPRTSSRRTGPLTIELTRCS
ncbi:MAG: hypothetical protein ACJ735_03860 [Actinomycetes bacterium]